MLSITLYPLVIPCYAYILVTPFEGCCSIQLSYREKAKLIKLLLIHDILEYYSTALLVLLSIEVSIENGEGILYALTEPCTQQKPNSGRCMVPFSTKLYHYIYNLAVVCITLEHRLDTLSGIFVHATREVKPPTRR